MLCLFSRAWRSAYRKIKLNEEKGLGRGKFCPYGEIKLPIDIIPVFNDYVGAYKVDDVLFPYTQRFIRYLITETAQKAGVKKKVSAQILRDTCAIRQLRKGEGMERVLERLGLSETTWEDAKIKYQRLSAGGL